MRSTSAWTVIVPVKDTARGKSRLRLPGEHRRSIALAMALDTAAAVVESAPVLAVVETASDAVSLSELSGVTAYRTRARGLNEAILDSLASGPRSDAPIAVLPADLPGLTAADLSDALAEALGHEFSVIPDRQGTGTTLLAARRPSSLRPLYGPGSFARHVAAGARQLTRAADSSLRADVDLVEDLRGRLGPRTRAALAAAGLADLSVPDPVTAAAPVPRPAC